MASLLEEITSLFDADEDVKEMILLGKLPTDIAQIATDSLSKKEQSESMPISFGSPEPYMHIASLLQKRFWPNAPDLKRGGFMGMLSGGPAPNWVVVMQVAAQIVKRARDLGYDVPECDMERMAKELDEGRDE
jgi:hypothetical protein